MCSLYFLVFVYFLLFGSGVDLLSLKFEYRFYELVSVVVSVVWIMNCECGVFCRWCGLMLGVLMKKFGWKNLCGGLVVSLVR